MEITMVEAWTGGCGAAGESPESLGSPEFAEDDPFEPTRMVVTPLGDSSTPLSLHGRSGEETAQNGAERISLGSVTRSSLRTEIANRI